MNKTLYTLATAAKKAKLSPGTLYRWDMTKRLHPTFRLNNGTRAYTMKDIRKALRIKTK